MTIESINPATGEKIQAYARMSDPEVDEAIHKSHEAFVAWRRKSFVYVA